MLLEAEFGMTLASRSKVEAVSVEQNSEGDHWAAKYPPINKPR